MIIQPASVMIFDWSYKYIKAIFSKSPLFKIEKQWDIAPQMMLEITQHVSFLRKLLLFLIVSFKVSMILCSFISSLAKISSSAHMFPMNLKEGSLSLTSFDSWSILIMIINKSWSCMTILQILRSGSRANDHSIPFHMSLLLLILSTKWNIKIFDENYFLKQDPHQFLLVRRQLCSEMCPFHDFHWTILKTWLAQGWCTLGVLQFQRLELCEKYL